MDKLRRIHPQAIPAALERANRYRILNEPREAESICRDVLEVDPRNKGALTMLLLSLTDQFGTDFRETLAQAETLVPMLETEYERAYYAGVVAERAGKALLHTGHPVEGCLDRIRDAMRHFDTAQEMAESGNDEALLRWNACVRLVRRHDPTGSGSRSHAFDPESFDDEVPR